MSVTTLCPEAEQLHVWLNYIWACIRPAQVDLFSSGQNTDFSFLGGFLNTMMIHTRCLSVPQQNPPVVLRIPSDELFESIKGISLNRLCLKIVLLLPLDSVQWMIDLGFYPVCLLVLKQKWGYGSSKPLVCTVHENIQFSLSFHECKVLGLFRLSLRQLCVG